MTDLELAKKTLRENKYTCVLCVNGSIYTTVQRGVRPLVQWLESKEIPKNFSAADKVVGKATAFLYCLLGAKAVYANVMSQSAKVVLEAECIVVDCDQLVDHIENRAKDGICPFEAVVLRVDDPATALNAIRRKMKEFGICMDD